LNTAALFFGKQRYKTVKRDEKDRNPPLERYKNPQQSGTVCESASQADLKGI